MSKKQPKLTEWFPLDVKPVRVGGYKFKYPNGYQFDAWWDGDLWVINDHNASDMRGQLVWTNPKDAWRGLAVKP